LRRRPAPPPPPLRQHRLLPAPRRSVHLAVVRDARGDRARAALHQAAPARRLASVADGRGRRDWPGRAGGVGLHGLPARDRQARQPHHPAAGVRAASPLGLGTAEKPGAARRAGPAFSSPTKFGIFRISRTFSVSQGWYAPGGWSPVPAASSNPPAREGFS